MRQPTLPLGVLAPEDVFVCFDIGRDLDHELRELMDRQPSPTRQAPRGVWLVKRGCFPCAVGRDYCRRHRQ